MYAGYRELTALKPESYLDWQKFETAWDSLPVNLAKAQAEYERGLTVCKDAITFHICANGTWSTDNRTKTGDIHSYNVTSYEGIGYHANTQHFLHGVLDSGCPVKVHRYTDDDITGTQIK